MKGSADKVQRIPVEVSVTTSCSFNKLKAAECSETNKRTKSGSASERVKIGFFVERKFNDKNVLSILKD